MLLKLWAAIVVIGALGACSKVPAQISLQVPLQVQEIQIEPSATKLDQTDSYSTVVVDVESLQVN